MSTSTVTKTKALKYRPVLTAAQITHILSLAKLESPMTDTSISVIATLSPFLAKIENAGITPAYSTQAATSKDLDLGGSYQHESKEAYWEHCYTKTKANPTSCSLEEIEAANEHRYIKDLMSVEEQAVFEQGNL